MAGSVRHTRCNIPRHVPCRDERRGLGSREADERGARRSPQREVEEDGEAGEDSAEGASNNDDEGGSGGKRSKPTANVGRAGEGGGKRKAQAQAQAQAEAPRTRAERAAARGPNGAARNNRASALAS
eukprot:scaffold13402_cov158-Isochrysis_galbana.AAC.2